MLKNALIGSVAGLAGGQALEHVAQLMYERTNPENVQREAQIEPRDPFIVLTQKVAHQLGVTVSEENQKAWETAIKTVLVMGTGMAYVATARRWHLGWLAGGMVFGTLFWLVEDEGAGPLMGLAGDNSKYPVEAHLRGLAAHAAFGVTAALVAKTLGVTNHARTRRKAS
jgi:uncharacterized membrane protein YagU involved in acid resistance